MGAAVRALLLGAAVTPVFFPLFTLDWFESHEAASYPARVVEVGRCWDDGMLSARWFPDLAGGRGVPFLSFYAPLSFWSAALPTRLGASPQTAWKLLVAAATFLAAAGAYRLARRGAGRSGALATAVLYAWAPYHLRDLWTRGDLAEYTGMAFLPWAIHATLHAARAPSPRTVAAAALWGAGAILAHNVLGLLTGLSVALAGIVALSMRDRSAPLVPRAGAVVSAGTLALLLSAFFWVPALVEKKWVQLESLRRGFFDPFQNFAAWGDVLDLFPAARHAVAGKPEVMELELGVVLLAALLAPLAWRRAEAKTPLVLGACLLAGGLLLSTGVSRPVYEAVPLLRFVGLPWRFLALASLGAALLGGLGVGALARFSPRAPAVGAGIVSVLAIAAGWTIAKPLAELSIQPWMLDPEHYRKSDFTTTVTDEYTPVWARSRERIPFREGVAATGRTNFGNIERGVARWRFVVEPEKEEVVILQDLFFPGWTGTLDGERVELVPREGSGHVQFSCPPGRHEFSARLGPTPLRRATGWASAAAACALLVLLGPGRRFRSPAP